MWVFEATIMCVHVCVVHVCVCMCVCACVCVCIEEVLVTLYCSLEHDSPVEGLISKRGTYTVLCYTKNQLIGRKVHQLYRQAAVIGYVPTCA